MFVNYLKVAWRNLIRNKTFSVINISGLALGITCSLMIMLWVQDEKNMDGFHANGKQLYQVFERTYYDGKTDAAYHTQGLLAGELKRAFPEIRYAAGLEYTASPGTANTFRAGNKVNKMTGFFAGDDFFKMFSFPLLAGSTTTALNAPGVISISKRMAENFFGSTANAIGKTIRFENKEDLLVSAVFDNIPAGSSLQFDFLRSWTDFIRQNKWVDNWSNTSPATFVQLRPNTTAERVEAGIKDFIYRYKGKDIGSRTELALQPFTEKYLYTVFKNGYADGGRIEYVNIFSIVAIFILLIACINFMNLATARSAKRAKEVGLRKVVGAARGALIRQFIGEAMLLTTLSVILAVILTALLLPAFNSLTGKQLLLPLAQPLFWLTLVALLLVTGFVAGSYPALFLSSLNPVKVLKGTMQFGRGAVFFRKGLVVFQFTLAVLLIAGMIIIYRQVNYIQTRNLGYDRDNLVYLPIEGELIKNYRLFKEEAAKLPFITDVSKMRNSPTVIEHHTGSIEWPGKDPGLALSFADAVVGYDFVRTMKLQLTAGRDFSKEFGSDTAAFMINETAAHQMGFENAVGRNVTWGNRPGKIIGVLKDFHFSSMHQAIEPLIVRLDENWSWGTILVRTKAGNTRQAVAALEKICKTINPEFPFTYQFSDLEFSKLYKSEELVSKLSNYFAILAIVISCLGLFGLATFTAAQRTKEIGVRKVIGASVPDIILLLSGSFLKLIVIALGIAVPVTWFVMHKWLENYAYKITVEWWVFALAGIITICIALLTVSYQSIRAAFSNPVKSLRAE